MPTVARSLILVFMVSPLNLGLVACSSCTSYKACQVHLRPSDGPFAELLAAHALGPPCTEADINLASRVFRGGADAESVAPSLAETLPNAWMADAWPLTPELSHDIVAL